MKGSSQEGGADAVVVHGASRGIGLALVSELSKENDQRLLVATCRQPENARQLRRLQKTRPREIEIVQMDAENESSVKNAAIRVKSLCETVSMMISCVGFLHDSNIQPERRLQDTTAQQLLTAVRVNAVGPLICVKHFEQFFERQKKTIVAALSARVGSITDNKIGGWYGYRASKAALNMYLKNLSIELPRRYQRMICVALHPGTVDTQLSRPFQQRIPSKQIFEPAYSARLIMGILSNLDESDNGRFIAWDGKHIPW